MCKYNGSLKDPGETQRSCERAATFPTMGRGPLGSATGYSSFEGSGSRGPTVTCYAWSASSSDMLISRQSARNMSTRR